MRKSLKSYSKIRFDAVKAFLSSGSLNEVASYFGIHPWTLKRWIRWYNEGGEKNLKREKKFRKSANRFDTTIEKKIVLLKERNPNITLSKAKETLERENIKVSINGIWCIWKRYGLTGFMKEKCTPSFLNYITETVEIRSGIENAEKALKKGNIEQAANILNGLPACPAISFLGKIPDKFLSLQRRVEKLYLLFGKIPFSELKKRAKTLREQSEDKELFYLSTRVGVLEGLALDLLQESEKLLLLTQRLRQRFKNKRGIIRGDPNLRFILLILEGHAYGDLLQIKKSLNCARKCKVLLRSFPYISEAQYWLATLFSHIGYHKEAGKLFKHILSEQKPEIISNYASCLSISGEYRGALATLRKIKVQLKGFASQASLVRAMCYLGEGKIREALSFAHLALKESKKEGFRNQYHIATLILASGYAALNEKVKAKTLLKRPMPILKKFRMQRDLLVRQVLLGKTTHINYDERENTTPPIRLALLLKRAQETLRIKDYRRAYNYARSQKIMGYFHLYLLFFPEPVHHILSKGKPSHLPSRFLRLPVFQKDIPTYHLKFLGSVRVYRNGKLIRARLSPKEAAFLIHLFLNQGKEIPLTSLYKNFWHESRDPERTFSHFLVNIRKYLKLSLRSLYITKGSFDKEKSLHFRSHITTDYQYYKETLAQAKALLRAGEWGFAKREYLRAFKLFRGEPFRKMYDDWSDDKRLEVLFSYEKEVKTFADELRKREKTEEAEKVLAKAEKIVSSE